MVNSITTLNLRDRVRKVSFSFQCFALECSPGASRRVTQVQNCADGTGTKRRKLHDHAKHGHENVGLNVVIIVTFFKSSLHK